MDPLYVEIDLEWRRRLLMMSVSRLRLFRDHDMTFLVEKELSILRKHAAALPPDDPLFQTLPRETLRDAGVLHD